MATGFNKRSLLNDNTFKIAIASSYRSSFKRPPPNLFFKGKC